MTTNVLKSPWGDPDGLYILVTNGEEVFRARISSSSNLIEDEFISVEWGELLADSKKFRGKFENVTGKFTEVKFPKSKKYESSEEVSKWQVIRGTIEEYRKVGTRVRIYSVLRTVDGIITELVPDDSKRVIVQYPGRKEQYHPRNLSFLIN